MNLDMVIKTAQDIEARLPYNIHFHVGQDGPLVWVRAWELREPVNGVGCLQRHQSERFVVINGLSTSLAGGRRDIYDACEAAASQLIEGRGR